MRTLKQDRERKELQRKESNAVPVIHPSQESLARRTELEKSLQLWSCYYLPDLFTDDCGDIHVQAFSECQYIIENGGRKAKCMPRGGGKSAIGKAAVIYCALTGKRKFIVPIGSNADNAQSYYTFITNALSDNVRLHEDYPEITTYFKELAGSAHKARFQLFHDFKPTYIQMNPKRIVLPNVMKEDGTPYPSAQSVIAIRSIDGRIRGTSYTVKGGGEIRPDFVIPDDIQSEETALSDVLSKKMEKLVVGAVLNLAGPRVKIACYFPCTVQRKGDVSWLFLNRKLHPEFQGDNIPMFYSFPNDHKNNGGLWDKYETIWRDEEMEAEKKSQTLNQFLKDNWDAMHEGASMSWDKRIRDGELSAVQTGMHLFYENGISFYSEYQGQPKEENNSEFALTASVILSRIDKEWVQGTVPEWSQLITATTDLNPSYALSTVVKCHNTQQRSGIVAWGMFKEKPLPINLTEPERTRNQKLHEALVIIGKRLYDSPYRPNVWGIDASGEYFDMVLNFCKVSQQLTGLKTVAITGRGHSKYNPFVKSRVGNPREMAVMCHDKEKGNWIAFDADYWKELSQKSWNGSLGAAGSCSLPVGNHKELAEQIAAEAFLGKADVGGMMKWTFKNAQLQKHDLGDCCYCDDMLASWEGFGTFEKVKQTNRRPRSSSGVIAI